ncbi:hypothetical protein CJ193_006785 [Pseudoglutamicibacter albus]|uniref:Uncharacterized protein n=1 Tax=Pseudoglutamicibacter cumminsii TaxID=156979 RepID=A0ABX5L7U3_9MICC|nr:MULTISPECIES: hypothetical protein [Pseudoglutamicibacter]MCT1686936.1 hypothetical protein [Pseudoglutamicibacter cumminsii]PKY80193.1 hypothetical protein CYJ35_05915 [Pseudoglutamicibacter albus]PWI28274.1 hypothetical protein CAY35_02180 [Pseudoglutamicibacter cumminsii]WIK83788.1 hypothetical protein CJ193_006785 [Pseudoglutamicibacter albus]
MNRKSICVLLFAPAVYHVFLLVLIVSSALPPRGLVLTVWGVSLIIPLIAAALMARDKTTYAPGLVATVAVLAILRCALFTAEQFLYDAYFVTPADLVLAVTLALIGIVMVRKRESIPHAA